jgi:hypothetical protein
MCWMPRRTSDAQSPPRFLAYSALTAFLFGISGCDQVYTRLSGSVDSNNEAVVSETMVSTSNPRVTFLPQGQKLETNSASHSEVLEQQPLKQTPVTNGRELDGSKPIDTSPSFTYHEPPTTRQTPAFNLQINKEVHLNNGVIFDMRPDVPEIRRDR